MSNTVTGISVVIPNFNGAELLPLILPTVQQALQALAIPSEIIVADDASTDNSLQVLKQFYSEVKVVNAERNKGFSPTANMGISKAIFPIVLLLNSDVKLEKDYFSHQLHYFANAKTFGVMGRIVGWDDDIIQDAAKYPRIHGVKIKTAGNYLPINLSALARWPSMYLSGANMLFRKSIFDEVGGFNELFAPFYVEDYELSLRAWRLGYSCYYEHAAICRHQVSKTIKANSKKSEVNAVYNRNKMLLHYIHLNGWRLYLWFVAMLFECFLQALLGKFYYIKSLRMFFAIIHQAKAYKISLKENSKGMELLTVQQVADNILTLISNKQIQIF